MEQEKNKLIQFRHIVKEFDGQVVLKGIDLDIYENEFVTLLGPSGCGKTTLLRILGGFLEPSEGQVILNGEDICEVPAYKRELNTVFQKYALFPHMNVYDNIAFGLKIKKMSKDVIDQKVMKMLKLIGLEGFENKDVTLLSGGQQQRVAIARALVNEPSVLLLDEPLSALDLKLRKEMQYELKKIQQEVGITFIFVTHDQEEALTMSDKIVIMKDGEIVQVGTSEEILTEPANDYVARFVENVDRSKIITAGSIMITNPAVARLRKEGPEVLIRKMKERDITVLPVIDENDKLIGEITLEDTAILRHKGIKSIQTAVLSEVHSVTEDTKIEDLLPLITKTNSPIYVVNEERELKGLVPLSSIVVEMTGKDKNEINELIQNAIEL